MLKQLLINVGFFETESDIIVQKIFRLLGVVRCNAHQVRVVLGDVCTRDVLFEYHQAVVPFC